MNNFDIYKDIAERTKGDIYIGVVGPVRSGKSTFITRFIQEMVLPNIDEVEISRVNDELPQSASGKTIMTTEPKFVPSNAVNILSGDAQAKIRLIDCVGYMVEGALGAEEENQPRLVNTPWSNEPMPFDKAGEIGTEKVVSCHSTIAVVVTTDGSFTDIPRANYLPGEERVIKELKQIGKPFIVIYNTSEPKSKQAENHRKELEQKYGVSVICANVQNMDKKDFSDVLNSILLEFPIKSFDVVLPEWMKALNCENPLIKSIIEDVYQKSKLLSNMKSISIIEDLFLKNDNFENIQSVSLNMANGHATICPVPKQEVFFKVLSDECGEAVTCEFELMKFVKELEEARRNYVKLRSALECAISSGYGVVEPQFDETELSEPEVVKKSGGYSVTMKAKAKSLHIIRADLETEVSPVFGSKKQCDDFVEYLKTAEEGSQWQTGVFGKPLHTIISDEVGQSSRALGEGVKTKLRKTLNRAVNEKKSNLFCILI